MREGECERDFLRVGFFEFELCDWTALNRERKIEREREIERDRDRER